MRLLRRRPPNRPGLVPIVLVPSLGFGRERPVVDSRPVLGATAVAGLLIALATGLVAASAMPPTVLTFEPVPQQADCNHGWPAPLMGRGSVGEIFPCFPEGLSMATWSLDSAFTYSAASTEVHVQVDEIACLNFYGARGRIAQNVRYRPDGIVITLAVLLPDRPGPCPGPGRSPYVVRLTEPVGNRPLLDGMRLGGVQAN